MNALPDGTPRLIAHSGVVLLLVGIWYLTLAPSAIGGPLSLVLVRGTSMEPTYATGDLVIGYRAGRPPVAGEVVVFRGPGGVPVIHRTRAVRGDELVTRGDNLPADDPWDTTVDDVLGTARLHVPKAGLVADTLAQPYVMGGFAALTVMLLVMARRDPDAEPDDGPDAGGGGGPGAVRERPRGEQAAPAALMATAERLDGQVLRAAPDLAQGVGGLAVACLLTAGALTIGSAASLTVTSDELVPFSQSGPFDTYVVNPGGGGNGGGNGGGIGGGNGGARP